MNITQFCRELFARYVPHYAYPRFEPSFIWEKFKPGLITKERMIGNKREILYLDRKAQQAIWTKMSRLKEIPPITFGVSSAVNDYLAHETAALLNLMLIRKFDTIEWEWCNSSFVPKQVNVNTKLVVIRSLINSEERAYQIRDIIDAYPRAMKILVVGGTDSVSFCDDVLGMPIHGALHIEGTFEKLPPAVRIKNGDSEAHYPPFALNAETTSLMKNIIRTRD